MNECSLENGEIPDSPTLPEEAEHSEEKSSVIDGAETPQSGSYSDTCVSYKDNMNAEGSQEEGELISDLPTLPEEAEHSQNKTNDNPSGGTSARHHHLMTTRELQVYWKKEKHESKPVKLLFQIHSTRIAEDFLSKFVMYQIVIIKTGSFDGKKVFIERRYSDFERLHRNLLKGFREEMEDIVFPKKVLLGNLTEEMINKRMMALKNYLEELYALKCVRRSQKYIEFFIQPELEEGYSCIRGGQYNTATGIFQQVVYLQEKLVEHCPKLLVPSLCAFVVCYRDMNQSEMAYEVGMQALELLEKHTTHRYYMPLLDTLVSLAYKTGKDYMTLREKMKTNEMKERRTFDFEMLTLKELVVQEHVKD
ncbi:sorting nexin-20 [Bufo gargarizans]|uniref:sorting nexin-20 n=1 Tax=Bufo gargarizans TaxID=30331 RepID=UPI001CF107F8|nr:sorting nexin-20 [Bufo gargarizans]XP_044126855.1 sorting nexin-20 [Bufo gargarizans]XP_044126856.1 sorting nexin-20 [Bufo gargarizans]